ncbi:hypothetical protein BGZ93_007210 [Podila epicladia]|nr:hypothetical protein BGZ92_010541 [Podila epicladia]KAG0094454.1 hypothetical protein BGZ93_007210 [Podila epicladia]
MSEAPDLGGAPQASFMGLMDKNHNKHDSMASTISTGTLDQAIHMAVKAKATPQLIRLNTIKAANSDLIQRSNSLHSSNSIKRTKSQRRLAEVKKLGKNSIPSSPLGNPFEQEPEARTIDQEEKIQEPEYEFTPAVMLTGPSARSSAQSVKSIRRIPGPTMVLEPRPIQKPQPSPSSTSSTLVPTPTTTPAPTALVSLLASPSPTPQTRNPFTSPSPSPTTASSPPAGAAPRISFEPTDPFSMEVQDNFDIDQEMGNLRPWTSNRGSGGGRRDSTFSTGSDARSLSTRADGEEIMIFWDGHRDSKGSLS